MKLLLLSAGSSIHTARWANGLSRAGVSVYLATQHPVRQAFDRDVEVIQFPYRGSPGYFLMSWKLRQLARALRPDILNAHFASGYGTTGRLVNWHPYLLSIWGSDVYTFPERSPVHRRLVKQNLMAADRVASTSHAMADRARAIAAGLGEIPVTPFGIDLAMFSGVPAPSPGNTDALVIGTVKALDETYGIDTLIQAFALLVGKLVACGHPLANRITLRLVGDGTQASALQSLSRRLGLSERVTFVGAVPHAEVPTELAKLDIYVALSRQESFGVAVLEAGAAGRPVVVSDAGGLPEVVGDGITGIVVPKEDPAAAAAALLDLVNNPSKRTELGQAARQHVRDNYAWDRCVEKMLSVYERTILNSQKKNCDS